jgi:hypothetical protein
MFTFQITFQGFAVAGIWMQKGWNQTAVACPQGALAALQEGNPGGGSEGALEGVLTHSLTGLSETHVSMFLDVATILRGERLEEVRAVWKAWHGDAAATYHADLVRRSLLGTDENGRLVMHDVLVALGRGIILQRKGGLEEHFGSRVWVQDGTVVGLKQVRLPPWASRLVCSALCCACSLREQQWTPLTHRSHSSNMQATVVMNALVLHMEQMCCIAGCRHRAAVCWRPKWTILRLGMMRSSR